MLRQQKTIVINNRQLSLRVQLWRFINSINESRLSPLSSPFRTLRQESRLRSISRRWTRRELSNARAEYELRHSVALQMKVNNYCENQLRSLQTVGERVQLYHVEAIDLDRETKSVHSHETAPMNWQNKTKFTRCRWWYFILSSVCSALKSIRERSQSVG